MNAKDVKPNNWFWDKNYPILILYEDYEEENYSIIWGKYKGVKALGVRWNGKAKERGFPGQGAYPTWYVEPDFIAIHILQQILTVANDNNETKYLANIKIALKELKNKMTEE